MKTDGRRSGFSRTLEGRFSRWTVSLATSTGTWDAETVRDGDRILPPVQKNAHSSSATHRHSYFGSYDTQGWGRHGEKPSCSLGQGVIRFSARATRRALGYEGLILFLDELILWLASHAADLEALCTRKARSWPSWWKPKHADRPIPVISFVCSSAGPPSELIGDACPQRRPVELRRRFETLGRAIPQDQAWKTATWPPSLRAAFSRSRARPARKSSMPPSSRPADPRNP